MSGKDTVTVSGDPSELRGDQAADAKRVVEASAETEPDFAVSKKKTATYNVAEVDRNKLVVETKAERPMNPKIEASVEERAKE